MASNAHGMPLSDRISEGLIYSEFDTTPHDFLPYGALDRIISPRAIKEAMDLAAPSDTDDELVSFILNQAKRLFAITADVITQPTTLKRAMVLFHKHQFDDRRLPIPKLAGQDLGRVLSQGLPHRLASMEVEEYNSEDIIWNRTRIWNFQKQQYVFLAPVLTTDELNHDLWDLTIPFVKKYDSYAEGSFGAISKYKIHEDHIKSSGESLQQSTFAVKKIKVDRKQSRQKVAQRWSSEIKAMAMMNKLDHKGHIVRFLTAFRRGKPEDPELYIITEWAKGGNLQNMWESMPNPPMTASFVKAVLHQLLGISEAFCAAHYLTSGGMYTGASYRHGDLKPANILFFPHGEFGTLKICDWGEAKNKQVVTAMRLSRTSAEYGTRRYEPPEVETGVSSMLGGSEDKRRSRLYDIWSIGCITLEMIVWLLYGMEGLNNFNQTIKEGKMNVESPFYELYDNGGKKEATVHRAVAYWMKYLAQDRACRAGTTALGDLLEIVERGLLVVNLPRRGGTFADHLLAQAQFATPETMLGKDNPNILSEQVRTAKFSPLETSVPTLSTDIPTIVVDSADQDHTEDPSIQPTFPSGGPERYRADQLRDGIMHITTTDEIDAYWTMPLEQGLPVLPVDLYSTTLPPAFDHGPVKRIDYGKSSLGDSRWTFESDNVFASAVFTAFQRATALPLLAPNFASNLCDKCDLLCETLWNPVFKITYDVQMLEDNANNKLCDICGLLLQSCQDNWGTIFPEATFERSGSFLTLNSSSTAVTSGALPVLSISRSPSCKSKRAEELQIGFGELPDVGSEMHFEILRQWIEECDNKHHSTTCKPLEQPQLDGLGRLPTRLIDVGDIKDDAVKLWETKPTDTGQWIALSHQWGPKGDLGHFSTTTDNRESFVNGIPLEQLPATFRDAVKVTRALGSRYLWIDSICIIQEGKDADFDSEAKRMEEVYSGARCVLAASCATGHRSGFLNTVEKRKHIAIRRQHEHSSPVYISQMIDNFKNHILEGALSKRGWVYQEHALARRTIFFDSHQTYWECGHGIRCETMTQLSNESAALLGDPDFPKILGKAKQGKTIEGFQEIYKTYSRLNLSKQFDRPNAIAGLQQRLLRTLNVQGGLGVFDGGKTQGLLRRSLLWRRGKDTPSLHRIDFSTDQAPIPSWSWMAHTGGKDGTGRDYPGGIDYFKPGYGCFDWNELQSPWDRPNRGDEDVSIFAHAQSYDRGQKPNVGEGLLIYDSPAEVSSEKAMCVILGVERGKMPDEEKESYVLLIVPTKMLHTDGSVVHERIGAGYLRKKFITGSPVPVTIH